MDSPLTSAASGTGVGEGIFGVGEADGREVFSGVGVSLGKPVAALQAASSVQKAKINIIWLLLTDQPITG